MINLEIRHLEIVQAILKKYPYTFYAFGSRAKDKAKRFSDLDICFKDPIPLNTQSHIEEDFEESNLPFKVDVVDWHQMTKDFQSLIEKDLEMIQKGSSSS